MCGSFVSAGKHNQLKARQAAHYCHSCSAKAAYAAHMCVLMCLLKLCSLHRKSTHRIRCVLLVVCVRPGYPDMPFTRSDLRVLHVSACDLGAPREADKPSVVPRICTLCTYIHVHVCICCPFKRILPVPSLSRTTRKALSGCKAGHHHGEATA